jgi:hypothetical protein
VSPPGVPLPVFPGGTAMAPEVTPGGGCAHDPCLCPLDGGRRYCSLACARAARADADTELCPCGHFGCTGHRD